MHILLTNDDGIDGPGLGALYGALCDEHRVSVVAPSAERSSCGHAATMNESVCVRRVNHPVMGEVFAVDGTPVDCVRLAVAELIHGELDCVVSGINRGANVSVVDVSQSGTVAGAREAAFCGILGIAVSQMFREGVELNWGESARITQCLLSQLFGMSAPDGCFWNVNIPSLGEGEKPEGVRVVPLSRDQIPLAFGVESVGTGGEQFYRYRGFYESRVVASGTDVGTVFGGDVAITPIRLDATDPSLSSVGQPLRL